MMKNPFLTIGIILIFSTLLGCSLSRKEIIASIRQADENAASDYYGESLQDAERALILYKQTLLSKRIELEDAYRYDHALGLVCGRLSLIYERMGQTNQAVAQMNESLNYFVRDSVSLDIKNPKINEQTIRQFIIRLDGKRIPKWQKERH
jgi:hypothetical protein